MSVIDKIFSCFQDDGIFCNFICVIIKIGVAIFRPMTKQPSDFYNETIEKKKKSIREKMKRKNKSKRRGQKKIERYDNEYKGRRRKRK